jgi:hypothetical protein
MFANHPVCKAAAPSIYHPVALTVEKFLYYFSRVESFSVSLSSVVEPLAGGSPPSNIVDGLATLSSSSSASYLFGNGETARVSIDGGENVRSEYPRFSFSRGGASIIVDFGKSVMYFGLLYPWVEIDFANGVSSASAGRTVGNVSIFGSAVPLYSSDAYSQIFAGGRVEELRAFDQVKLLTSSNTSATFAFPFGFGAYTETSLGGVNCPNSIQGEKITVSIPQNAKSGHVRFSSNGPHSSFLSIDRVNLL